ncbi:MAG: hypothetical protein AB7O65_03450 [Candidatus Korobacteraceae bacterium]
MRRAWLLLLVGLFIPGLMMAQGAQPLPGDDKVEITLPQRVTVENQVLEPGKYEIQEFQPPNQSESTVVHIFKDNRLVLKTTAQAAPTGGTGWADETKAILRRQGDKFYLDKIWIQGKQYGYQFQPPGATEGLTESQAGQQPSDQPNPGEQRNESQQSRE